MKSIAVGKKRYLESHKVNFTILGAFTFMNIFTCDLFTILVEVPFTSYANDSRPFVSEALEWVVSFLESFSATLFKWFSNNRMKATTYTYTFIIPLQLHNTLFSELSLATAHLYGCAIVIWWIIKLID